MSDTDQTNTITISARDEVFFRLKEGCRPYVYPDTIVRVSYEIGVNVIHTGTIWVLGYLDDAEALELDDRTVVVLADIDPGSLVVNPTPEVGSE